jgi:sugar lactone lactonase YvrE
MGTVLREYKLEKELVGDFCLKLDLANCPWGEVKSSLEFDYSRGRADVIAVDEKGNVFVKLDPNVKTKISQN